MSEPRTYRLVRFSDLMASETMVTMVTQLRNEADKVERCPGYEYHHTASLLRYAAAKISLLTRELETARKLIRELVDDVDAGIVWLGRRLVCAYCDGDGLYSVRHDGNCPIVRARTAITTDTEGGDGE